jgi:hypothetical protein
VGDPVLPVVFGDGAPDDFEGQVFYSTQNGRPMYYLLVRGADERTVHPIPGPIANYYITFEYCMGVPTSDPVWHECRCGKLQVLQRFGGIKTGVVYTFDKEEDDHKEDDDKKHDFEGEPLKECEISFVPKETTPFKDPDGNLCIKK